MCLSEYLFCRSYYYRTDLPGALNQINEYKSVGPSMLISGRVLKKLLLLRRSSPHGMASQLIGSFPYLASNRAGHQSPRGRQKHKGLSIFIGPESDHWLCLLTHSLTHSLTDSRLVNLFDVTLFSLQFTRSEYLNI